MKTQKVALKDGPEKGRPFEAVQIEGDHLRALMNWGGDTITMCNAPIVFFRVG